MPAKLGMPRRPSAKGNKTRAIQLHALVPGQCQCHLPDLPSCRSLSCYWPVLTEPVINARDLSCGREGLRAFQGELMKDSLASKTVSCLSLSGCGCGCLVLDREHGRSSGRGYLVSGIRLVLASESSAADRHCAAH